MRVILVLSILLTGAALAAEVTLEPHVDDHVWYDIDVTDIVQSWIDGDMDHYGFYIRNSVGDEKVAYIMSGDYFLDYSLAPKLTLVYTGSEVQSASWGEIKAGF